MERDLLARLPMLNVSGAAPPDTEAEDLPALRPNPIPARRPLIEIIRETAADPPEPKAIPPPAWTPSSCSGEGPRDIEKGRDPLPLAMAPAAKRDESPPPRPPASKAEERTVMDDVMAIVEQAEKERAREQAKVKKEGFGSGFKKGFLSAAATTKPPRSGAAASTAMAPTSPPPPSSSAPKPVAKPEVVTILRPSPPAPVDPQWQLPEVQRAMDAAKILREDRSWADATLLQHIAENPRLAEGLKDPRVAALLQELQVSPQTVIWKLQADPSLGRFFQELMGTLGQHFEHLGHQQQQQQGTDSQPPLSRQPGPLEEAATHKGTSKKPMSPSEEQQVQAILRDEELRLLLLDPAMQHVLQECNTPEGLARHLSNPQTKAKIMKMARAGLVRIEL